MGPMQYDYNKRLMKSTTILLSDFLCNVKLYQLTISINYLLQMRLKLVFFYHT